MRVAVVGHVEHVTVGRVAEVPGRGEIAHLASPCALAGGGGGLAFHQLARSDAEVHLFTALGGGEAGAFVAEALARSGARIHAARREVPHTRVLAMVTPDGERTLVVLGEPLHPEAGDVLPWELLASCDAAYFTAADPAAIRRARAARVLVVTARRREALARSGVRADVVVGSAADAREASALADYPIPPVALVMTEGARGGRVETARGVARFDTSPVDGGAYGAGDAFAGALTYFLGAGLPVDEACARAALHGAAMVGALDPVEAQRPLHL